MFLIGPPEHLAVDGDEVRAKPGERTHPGDEAALELLRIEHGEDIAELVMRGRADLEGPEPAQQSQLLLAELGDLHPAFAAGEKSPLAQ